MTISKNLIANTEHEIRNFLEAVQAHYAIHPDKDICGGVGGCSLLMLEHQQGQEIVLILETLARTGEDFTLNVVRR